VVLGGEGDPAGERRRVIPQLRTLSPIKD
jgi:hypothetical protein